MQPLSRSDSAASESNDCRKVSSRVPFKWEEAPGKPITAQEMMAYTHTSLQLPPKLQCPGHQPHLFSQQSPYKMPGRLHRSSPLSIHSCQTPSPRNHHKLKSLYKYMLKTASWSQPPSQFCSSATQSNLSSNERFFFDKAIPKDFKYSVSIDSWKAHPPIHNGRKPFVNSNALSFFAMEDHEAESTASSPLHPIMFCEQECYASPWQPTPIKAFKEVGGDDEDDDEGFNDLFSRASSSLEKPSQRTDESTASSCPSPDPWFLDFGPEEDDVHHEDKGGSKLVVRLVAIVKLKKIITSKVCKIRERRRGANQPPNNSSIWSPTLATYLFNQQKEEREGSSPCLNDYLVSEKEEELPSSSSSVASSHRFQINPNYHLPSSILRGHLQPDNDFSEDEGSSSFRVHQLSLRESPHFSEEDNDYDDDGEEEEEEEEEPPHKLSQRLSLREQLSEFGDEYEYPLSFATTNQSTPPQFLDSKERDPIPCKGLCRVRKTVKVLAATIKLILVQTEVGKRKGGRPSLGYGGCLRPHLSTTSPLPSVHK